jgi:dTDP-glucose 4,6-dehydratase
VDTRIVRIFNTFGPRMRVMDGRAIPAFISQALRGDDVTVFGEGSQTRSVCYVDDLVEGIVRLLKSHAVDPMNIGNPDELSMLQLAQEIIELTGSKSKIIYEPLPEDDPKIRQPDITAARSVLGWQPSVDRRQGLQRTIEYFRKALSLA